MDFSVSKEAFVFLYSVLAGILICMVYDLFRVIRQKAGSGKIFTDIQDIIFWMIATIIMFFIIFFSNNGTVRWYEFFGVALGSILYKFTVSYYITWAIGWFIDVFAKIFALFFKILLTPLLFMYNIIAKCVLTICMPMIRMLKMSLKRLWGSLANGAKRARTTIVKK